MHLRRTGLVFVLVAVLAGCTSSGRVVPPAQAAPDQGPEMPAGMEHITYSGGDGATCEHAVVIQHARNTTEGIRAENVWIAWKHPGGRKSGQSLVFDHDRPHDVIRFVTSDGEEATVCFDISGFFGAW